MIKYMQFIAVLLFGVIALGMEEQDRNNQSRTDSGSEEVTDTDQQESNTEASDQDSGTALMRAIQSGSYETVMQLINAGASINQRNYDHQDSQMSYTPLMLAASRGNTEIVDLLLNADLSINQRNDNHQDLQLTPTSHVENWPGAQMSYTPLMLAASRDHHSLIALLLDSGAPSAISEHDQMSNTAFMTSAVGAHLPVPNQPMGVVDINQHDTEVGNGPTPLMSAVMTGDAESAERILAQDKFASAKDLLQWAIEAENMFLVDYYAQKVNVNEPGAGGFPPIIRAVVKGNCEIIQVLLDHGADVNCRGPFHGWTPLMIAVQRNNLAVIKLLVGAGADVGAVDHEGRTAAVMSKSQEVQEYLWSVIDSLKSAQS